MKNIMPMILALVCFIFMTPVAASAAEELTCDLPELNLTISVPQGWITFTRDVDADDPNLAFIGTDSKTLTDYYKENNVYLNTISVESNAEIVVTMVDYEGSRNIYDFNRVSDKDMNDVTEAMMTEMKKQFDDQVTYSGSSVYSHKQAKFAVFNFTRQENGVYVYGIQYYTIINGQAINIISYSGEVSDDLKQTLKAIVDSATFNKVTSKPLSIDLTKVLYAGLLGAAIGLVVGLVLYVIRKKTKKKSHAAAGTSNEG